MLISAAVKKLGGVREAVVAMGTETNRTLLAQIGFAGGEVAAATPNDLLIALEAEEEAAAEGALAEVRRLLSEKRRQAASVEGYRPVSLEGALRQLPGANLAVVSVPGRYAAREARLALERGLHVMLFSDNVPLEQEIALKRLASAKGLLLMGPDCGTAIINGKPLCFANVVRRGGIGLVAASGTGLQEVTCLIDRLGGGVSQAIGTGGRDLSPQVGGSTVLMGIEVLKRDPQTQIIVVLSKPPAPEVARKVLGRLRECGKPAVVHFIGLRGAAAGSGGRERVRHAGSLEESAGLAVSLLQGSPYDPAAFAPPEEELQALAARAAAGMGAGQRYLRGLFTGGTLADEALFLLEKEIGEVYSNNQIRAELRLADAHRSRNHTVVDLGDDVFTVGRPHPMIDPGIRTERILQEGQDAEVAVLLLDCVLGYGSHPDPAGAMLDSLIEARERARKRGGALAVVASVTGTAGDPQNLQEQTDKLASAGCLVMPSNYQASRLACRILREMGRRRA
jgi:succinyl-CoA synthetase alpha subunit